MIKAILVFLTGIVLCCPFSAGAATKNVLDVLGDLSWSNVVPDTGYGIFAWGDAPFENDRIVCTKSVKPASFMSGSWCYASADLPPIGLMTVKKASWHFSNGKMDGVKLDVEMDEVLWRGIPQSVTIKNDIVDAMFMKHSGKEAALALKMKRPILGTNKQDLFENIDVDRHEDLPQYLHNLGMQCYSCRDVLDDYLSAFGFDTMATPAHAEDFLNNSPIVSYLMALKSFKGDSNFEMLYAATLDQIKLNAGNVKKMLIPTVANPEPTD